MAAIICPVCNKSVWTFTKHINSNGVITHWTCKEEYISEKGLDGATPKKKNIGSNDEKNKSLKEFSNYYLTGLKSNLASFADLFTFISVLFWMQIFISLIVAVYLISEKDASGAFALITLAINITVIIWLASTAKSFISLQIEKIEYDIHNKIEFQTESIKMSEDILDAAMKKAVNNITMNNGNAVFAFDGGTVHGVSQSLEIKGDNELVESLAKLLVACKESNNDAALSAAKSLSEEATKDTPDKGTLFELWSKITGLLPEVTSIVEISKGIKELFL